jgi:hypothetical protein
MPLALASSVGSPTAELVATMLREPKVSSCAADSGTTPNAYIARAFDLRSVTLKSGTQMAVATATDPCLTLGASTKIMIFARTRSGYRRVLDDVTLPGLAEVRSDGSVMLPTHESMDVIFEATYLWNGTTYVFSATRSHRYDVALGERRPYEVPVRLAPGQSATTLSGTVAYTFGDTYVFQARKGQRLALELTKYTGARPRIALYFKEEISSLAELNDTGRWSGELQRTGEYHLLVSGSNESDEARRGAYTIRLAIH